DRTSRKASIGRATRMTSSSSNAPMVPPTIVAAPAKTAATFSSPAPTYQLRWNVQLPLAIDQNDDGDHEIEDRERASDPDGRFRALQQQRQRHDRECEEDVGEAELDDLTEAKEVHRSDAVRPPQAGDQARETCEAGADAGDGEEERRFGDHASCDPAVIGVSGSVALGSEALSSASVRWVASSAARSATASTSARVRSSLMSRAGGD